MPTYKRGLMEEHLRRMVDRGTIDAFLQSFAVNSSLGGDQRTLIFLPGGLASELARANQEFDSSQPSNSYSYDTIWYDFFGVTFLQEALLLDMNGDEDKDRRLIVADGAIETCVYGPYDNFKTWCGAKQIDLLVVGWDFRRRSDWIVEFVFDYLVPDVRQRAHDAGLGDPFARATLVGHSFGGMVCKWLMNEHARPFAQELQLVVTVGSPFYGYGGHTHRFFKGEPMVGSTYNLTTLTKVISTMKGGYSLMFCDGSTYDTYEADLMADPKYPPPGYPSIDATDPTVRADPYNPGLRNSGESRYPQNWSWHAQYLADGLQAYQEIAQPLDASVKGKFHCIRGVQVDAEGTPIANTRVSQRWSWVRSSYNPNSSQSPVFEIQADMGFGDDTQPAWSARLVTQDPGNIHTIEGQLSHMSLMDDSGVRVKLLQLMRPAVVPDPNQVVMGELRFDPAPRVEFLKVKKDLEAIALQKPKIRKKVLADARAYIAEIPFGRRQSLLRTWFMELLRGPVTDVPPPRPGTVPLRGRHSP